ncbi:MAG: tetratricopeptide repeat protein [Candidatus Electrothrix sp. AW3_4]|nr:tetratricopeptide repeat protein [Candidatus Electrothrix gigas]
MKKNKCGICLKVKGKRLCKLQNKTFICPRCCAEIRHADCEGCRYYTQAEQYALEKKNKSEQKKFIAKIDPEIDDEVEKALAYVEKGAVAQGETILSKLIKDHPELYTVQYGMGTLQAMKGNYKESIVYFDKCLEIFPYFTEAWFNRGSSYKHLLDMAGTIKSFQKVVQLGDPKEDFVQSSKEFLEEISASVAKESGLSLDKYLESNDIFNDAFALLQNHEYEKAIIGFNKVLRLNNKHPQTYGNLGLCHAFLGQKEKALAYFDQALEIDPAYGPALSNRSFVELLEEGEKLPADHLKSVEYYKEVAQYMDKGTRG